MALFVFALFLCMAWFTAEHFPPWVSWHNEIWAFAAVIWATGCVLFSNAGRFQQVSFPFAAWPLGFLVVVVVIQTAAGQIALAGDAWVLLFYLTLCIGAMAVGHRIGTFSSGPGVVDRAVVQTRVSQFAVAVLLGGLGSVVLAFGQSLELWANASWLHHMPGPRRPGAHLGQTNQLATLILFAISSLLFLYESRKLSAVTALPMAAILLFGLALTESRTGALGLLFLAVWWSAKRRSLGFALSWTNTALWLTFFGVCFWFWPSWLNFILIGGAGEATHVNLQAGTRLLVWPQLWEAVLKQPWFGWGVLNVSEALNSVLHAHGKSENFTYAHNILLDLAIGVGLPITVILLVAAGAWLWRRLRDTNSLLSWYCLALALPFGVHSMLEFPFAYAYLLVPVMFLIGVLEAQAVTPRTVRIQWWPVTAVWALVSMAMAWSLVEYIVIEEDFRVARFEVLNVGQTPPDYERPQIVLLTQLDALLEGARLEPKPGMSEQRLELARNVALRFPGPATHNRYAVSLALNGNPKEAERQVKVMRVLYGERNYAVTKSNWEALAKDQFPQLRALNLP